MVCRDLQPDDACVERAWNGNLPRCRPKSKKELGARGAQGPRRGRHARGRGRGPARVPAAAPLHSPAPGRRVRLTLQNDLLERLSLQPVATPQFLRDVALPAGKVCGAEARRHAQRCPGASRPPPIRADTGSRGPQRAASRGRTGAARRTLTSTHRTPLRLSGMIFRSLTEIILEEAGRPASLPEVVGRAHACSQRLSGTLSNDTILKPEASMTQRQPL